jgi:hypothetical protein
MGVERVVTFAGPPPGWAAIQKEAAAAGLALSVRMIDGLPAFPDEEPADGWREVRVSTPGGMISLRQSPGAIAAVVWGNADEALRREWESLAQAIAAAGGGTLRPDASDSCGH